MNEPTQTLNANAIDMHNKAAGDIGRLLDVLETELQKVCDQFEADVEARRRVHTQASRMFRLCKIRNDLVETLALLSGSTQEQIEDFLADADA